MIFFTVLGSYAGLVEHYQKKWSMEKIDQKYQRWETDQEMRSDYGFDDKDFKKIPKRKIKNRASRIKHGY